jgi:hypothetical protein
MRGRIRGLIRLLAGAGISLSPSHGTGEVTIANTRLAGHVIQNAGVDMAQRSKLNFQSGFTVSDDPTNDRTNVVAAGGGGGGGWDPVVEWRDMEDFVNLVGSGAGARIGANWTLTQGGVVGIDAAGTIGPGIIRLETAASTGSSVTAVQGLQSNTLTRIPFSLNIDILFYVRPLQSTAVQYVFGISTTPSATNPTDGAFFRRDTAFGDTNWLAITRSNNAETQTNTGVAFDTTAFHKFRIVITPGVRVEFYIDGTLVATHTTNIPRSTVGGIVGITVTTREGVAKQIQVDLVVTKVTGIGR